MNPSKRSRKLLVAVVVVASIGGLGFYAWRWMQPRHASVDVTIVSLDAATRSGIVSFVHPKSGERYELRGELAPECEILVDGQPAEIGALKPGERGRADGMFYRSGKIVATRLDLKSEPATPASAVTSAPSTP